MTASLRRTTLGNGGLLLVSILLVSFLARPLPFRLFMAVVPPTTLIVFLLLRRFLPSSLMAGRFLPKSAPRPSLPARVSETIFVSVAGVFVLLCFWHGIGLRQLNLALRADGIYLAALCVGLFLTATTAWLAARGRGQIAMLELALGMTAGGIVVERLVPTKWGSPHGGPSYLVFRPSDSWADSSDLPAEVWINGTYLGRAPVVISTQEFARRVPYPTSAPAEATDLVRVPQYTPDSVWMRREHQFLAFDLPTPDASRSQKGPKYYAQFRIDDEIGSGAFSGGGSGSQGDIWMGRVEFRVTFAQVQHALNNLLNQVRLNDYRATPGWYQTMHTYGHHGERYLRDAAEKEPPLMSVWDNWARHHYGLDQVHDSAQAWDKLGEIQREAVEKDWYFTCDLAGRAVELLVPQLDASQLARAAVARVRTRTVHSYMSDHRYGRLQFGSGVGLGHRLPVLRNLDSGMLSPGDFVLAHAVWMKNEELRGRSAVPNVIQLQVGSAVMCWGGNTGIAGELGWPGLDAFLLRQDWSAPVDIRNSASYENRLYLSGAEVNRWLYELANRNSVAAASFRAGHRRELIQMADTIMDRNITGDVPKFLFVDAPAASGSLAEEYWPSFYSRALHRNRGPDPLEHLWEYLVKMDPLSTPAMYVQCLHDAPEAEIWIGSAVQKLRELPLARRELMVEALVADVQTNITVIKKTNSWEKNADRIKRLQSTLRSCLVDQETSIIEQTLRPRNAERRAFMGDWLEFESPEHPVVPRLAASWDSQVRRLVLRAVFGRPTPANRALLQQLLADPDPQVQDEAKHVQKRLGALATRPADDFALKVSGLR